MSFGIACLAFFALRGIGSEYIFKFLTEHIVNIQIGLLAINTATLGVVLTKLRDLVDKGVPLSKFTSVRREMLLSIQEQVALIVLALMVLSIADAAAAPFHISQGFLKILLLTCFVYSISILYDTAKSVFIVLDE